MALVNNTNDLIEGVRPALSNDSIHNTLFLIPSILLIGLNKEVREARRADSKEEGNADR